VILQESGWWLLLTEGCDAECAAKQVRIPKAPAKLALQSPDRVQVLRRAWIFVFRGRKARQQLCGRIGQRHHRVA
jgi:hypothetical protein